MKKIIKYSLYAFGIASILGLGFIGMACWEVYRHYKWMDDMERTAIMLGQETAQDSLIYYYNEHEWDKALDQLLRLHPDSLNEAMTLVASEVLAANDNIDKGLEILDKAFKEGKFEKKYFYYYEKGLLLNLKGEKAQAIANYEKAIDIRPAYIRPYVNLAEIYKDSGDKQKAAEYYTAALELFYTFNHSQELRQFSKVLKEVDSKADVSKYIHAADSIDLANSSVLQ